MKATLIFFLATVVASIIAVGCFTAGLRDKYHTKEKSFEAIFHIDFTVEDYL